MATWPATLPQYPLVEGNERTAQSQTIRTDMDSGPAFQRRRFTAASELFQMVFVVDKTQRQTFWDFFNNTLGGGAVAFDWQDPITEVAASFRFMADSVPVESAFSNELFQISANVEKLP